MLDLEAIKARCEAATTGPWTHEIGEYSGDNWLIGSLYLGTGLDNNTHTVHVTTDHVHASELWGEGAGGDAEFIAHAREDVPALVAEVARLQGVAKRLEVLKAELDQIYAGGKHADLSQFSCGVAAGIQQAVLWALEPESWAEPISTIGLPK